MVKNNIMKQKTINHEDRIEEKLKKNIKSNKFDNNNINSLKLNTFNKMNLKDISVKKKKLN
jgi:hypothetical protein